MTLILGKLTNLIKKLQNDSKKKAALLRTAFVYCDELFLTI